MDRGWSATNFGLRRNRGVVGPGVGEGEQLYAYVREGEQLDALVMLARTTDRSWPQMDYHRRRRQKELVSAQPLLRCQTPV